METIIHIKYTKNIDYFIVILLPYIEIFLKEYQHISINFYTQNEELCNILFIMFGDRIITNKVQNMFYISNPQTYETDLFLRKFYDIDEYECISRPLCLKNTNITYKVKNNICIFPKFSKTCPKNNITYEHLKLLINKNSLVKYDIYFIGDPMDRLNTHIGRDILNFSDTMDILQNCNIFITTVSQWYYIALICNCRNIILYDNNDDSDYSEVCGNPIKNIINNYNPFNSNVLRVSDLSDNSVSQFITSTISSKK
jgi:hypothetical protein